eukprot:NODE_621_length_5335_cov_0.249618.p2 type:complete len:194 gc:universal NODE_621_length_5335_cov_0.249618:1082-501(-)
MKEPKCCCGGIRLGLCIMYAFFLLGGVLSFVTGSALIDYGQSTYGVLNFVTGPAGIDYGQSTYGAISIVQGVIYVLVSLIGFASIKSQKVKIANSAMWSFVVAIIAIIILYIVILSTAGAIINERFDQMDSIGFKGNQLSAAKNAEKSTLVAQGIASIGLTIIFGGIIAQRLFLYKKWLISREKIDSTFTATK